MKLLVTGGRGFIGGRIADYFREHGIEVRCVDRAAKDGSDVSAISAALLAESTAGFTPDVIVHAAGSGSVAHVSADPAGRLASNVASLVAVLEYARESAGAAHIVVLSSAALYGNAPAAPQKETDSRLPVSLYGIGKLQAEQLGEFYSLQYGIKCSVIRLFSVYGPGLRKQLLWDAMLKYRRGEFQFFGTGMEVRDWVHVRDVQRFVYSLALNSSNQRFSIYNCAGGNAATTCEVLTHLAQEVGGRPPVFNGSSRAGDPVAMIANCDKAREELAWQPTIPWRKGVTEYANWFISEAAGAGTA